MTQDVKTSFPSRYYAKYDPKATQPTPITGWYDTWEYGDVSVLPPIAELFPLTSAQWQTHIDNAQTPQAISNLQIVDYNVPVSANSLKIQAQSVLNNIQSQAAIIVAMGKTFGEKTRASVTALEAIINGTDTASTTLPEIPSDLTT